MKAGAVMGAVMNGGGAAKVGSGAGDPNAVANGGCMGDGGNGTGPAVSACPRAFARFVAVRCFWALHHVCALRAKMSPW